MVGSDGKIHYFVVGFSTYDLISSQVGAGKRLRVSKRRVDATSPMPFLTQSINPPLQYASLVVVSLVNYMGNIVQHDLQSRRRHLSLIAPVLAPLSQRAMLRGEPAKIWKLSDNEDLRTITCRMLASPEDAFCFRRTLAREMAYSLMMRRIFGNAKSDIYLDGNGSLVNQSFPLAFDESGIICDERAEIPAEIKGFLGDLLVTGVILPTLTTLTKALVERNHEGSVEAFVAMFLSSALLEWHAARSGNKNDAEMLTLRKTLQGRTETNVDLVKTKLGSLVEEFENSLIANSNSQ